MNITDLYNELDDRELDVDVSVAGEMESEEKERILRKTITKIHENESFKGTEKYENMPGRHRKRKAVWLVLAAALLMAGTVSAAEYFRINGNLRSFLGISQEYGQEELEFMTENLVQAGVKSWEREAESWKREVESWKKEDESWEKEAKSWKTEDEHDGVKISARQTVSDGETIYIYFDIEFPEEIFVESDDNITRMVRFISGRSFGSFLLQ